MDKPMNHNKFGLTRGESVILDKDFINSSEVIIVDFTPNEILATVRSFGSTYTWEVMTSRLTPIEKQTK